MAPFDQIHEDLFTEPPSGRPTVTLSYAQSLDGCITVRRGEPLALSGSKAMQITHQLRAVHTGILAGIGTILADDPQLNVRLVDGPDPQPIILDSTLRTPAHLKLFEENRKTPFVFTTRRANLDRKLTLERAGARVVIVPEDEQDQVDITQVLTYLYQRGIKQVMVEGGAQVITSFLKHQLVDHIVLTIAPVFVGGLGAVERNLWPARHGKDRLGRDLQMDFPRIVGLKTVQVEDDLIIWGKPQWKNH